jgi:hypothetical protein
MNRFEGNLKKKRYTGRQGVDAPLLIYRGREINI